MLSIENTAYSSIEHDILQIIAENPEVSQRNIAEKTQISLGQANFLMKKFIKMGLIKIEGQSSKSLKYNLTPKGIVEKTAMTLHYIKISYLAVIALSDKITMIADEYKEKKHRIYIIDKKDEMTEIVKIALERIPTPYLLIKDHSEIDTKQDYILFVWDNFDYPGITYKNVLE